MAMPRLFIVTATELPGLSRAATIYAVRELARRSGISRDLFDSWHFDFANSNFVDVYVQPGSRKRIRFPRADAARWKRLRAGIFYTSTACWWSENNRYSEVVPDFKIPFSSLDSADIGPLFVRDSEDSFACSVDLPFSALLTLSRFEETLPCERDVHGRFSAFSSIAWRDAFLHRPIVDEYGLALEQIVSALLPGWKPARRELRVKLSHDIDEIGIPFSLRGAVAQTFRNHMPLATVRDLFAPALGIDTTYQVYLRNIVQLALDRSLGCSAYWKFSRPGPYDTGYDPRDRRLAKQIQRLRSQNVELGIHPGYASFLSFELFRAEVQSLRLLFGEYELGGRQDYLRWSPQTWLDWDALGLAYDSSVGFADHVGFRAGTSFPYRPWLWAQQRQADLVEIPLLSMDSTLLGYMKLRPAQAQSILHGLLARCRAVGGVFTLAWHNTRILDRQFASVYQAILDEIAGCSTFDWRSLRT
jgi:hypothetical protein